ncbi:MAG: hypothetical protein P1V18_00040 [Candidatus Gracilibacteria bacterium]|nr:hypothetical protein [Candidatus Gracilibacteria bacterium]
MKPAKQSPKLSISTIVKDDLQGFLQTLCVFSWKTLQGSYLLYLFIGLCAFGTHLYLLAVENNGIGGREWKAYLFMTDNWSSPILSWIVGSAVVMTIISSFRKEGFLQTFYQVLSSPIMLMHYIQKVGVLRSQPIWLISCSASIYVLQDWSDHSLYMVLIAQVLVLVSGTGIGIFFFLCHLFEKLFGSIWKAQKPIHFSISLIAVVLIGSFLGTALVYQFQTASLSSLFLFSLALVLLIVRTPRRVALLIVPLLFSSPSAYAYIGGWDTAKGNLGTWMSNDGFWQVLLYSAIASFFCVFVCLITDLLNELAYQQLKEVYKKHPDYLHWISS